MSSASTYWIYLIGSIIRVSLVFSTSEPTAKILLFKIALFFLGPHALALSLEERAQALLLAWPLRPVTAQPSLTFLVSAFYIPSGGLPSILPPFSSLSPKPSFSSSDSLTALLFHQPLADLIPVVDASGGWVSSTSCLPSSPTPPQAKVAWRAGFS